ncbi:MAG: hypothetical protein ACRD2R_09070 [Terriglobales bacterium]
MKRLLTPLTLLSLIVLAGCALPSAPQPPSLRLPRPVTDLEAARKGDKVHLSWTPPVQTTDGESIREAGMFRVCRATPVDSFNHCFELPAPVAEAKGAPPPRATFADELSAELQSRSALGYAEYAVETLNARGRGSGPSNHVRVPLAPTLEPPASLRAAVGPEGITLFWRGRLHQHELPALRHRYRISRRAPGIVLPVVVGEVLLGQSPDASLVDRNFEWEKTYLYRVSVVSVIPRENQPPIEVEGADSAEVEVFVHDAFPPAVPAGVEAVYSGSAQRLFVDLTWSPGTEADLAGYYVYRRSAANGTASPRRLNAELVTTPAFRDPDVEPGTQYLYSVSAVDLRGNESEKSVEAEEAVPSARAVNRALNRMGRVWQEESFDHVLRSNESLSEKVDYVCQNPVRAGLVTAPELYPWLWRGKIPEL